jgi:hypothetical protein
MTRRMLDSAIWKNEKFAVMPPLARLLAIGIINCADDQGRGKAHPAYLRSEIFPYEDVTTGEIAEWLEMIADNETVLTYQVNGKDYYQILNWWTYQSHQYAMPSQYPKPPGWRDRIRKTFTRGVIVTCNWITTDGKRSPDTCDEQGLAIQVKDQVKDQVNAQGEGSGEGTSSSISSSIRSSSKDAAEDALIDPELAQALTRWKEIFAGTPNEATPPIAMLPKWLAYSGVDVLCYMIDKAKDKSNPAGYLYTTYDNWRQDGEVAPYVQKAVANGKKPAPAELKVTHIIDPITKEVIAV